MPLAIVLSIVMIIMVCTIFTGLPEILLVVDIR